MPSFVTRLGDGWRRALDVLPLALVPVLTALLNTEKLWSVLTFDGFHVSLQLAAPVSVVDVWTFVNPPSQGGTVQTGVPMVGFPLVLLVVPAALALQAALIAGYFGSLQEALVAGRYDFAANVRRFFLPFLVLTGVPVLLLLPFGFAGASGGLDALFPLVVLSIPVFVVLAYLFAATPYLLVLRETDLLDALRASYGLAIASGAYLRYLVGFLLFVLVLSPFASLLVVNVPVVGLVVGVAGGAVLGLAANLATMRFVADIDPESPAVGTWADTGAE
ncbi:MULTISPECIES: hypothetical protein [Haloarcula]|uniref:DUF4013 domain-containing protein n=1 Tax=Haloarcula pellucida TaxID=1427151 RepID=A0A830GM20_9EURY|nr:MULTISPECIES: hypothetical protein [Halomicroarcula]MBX0348923.1 hypothetical protein [Halomicroarcula pellucida]MDS0278687.1 hypothetical protein [Halomicroarcula sp. S1AR25-4]GGN91227.1 hypothetical protein GCM10009030_13880 [Halomicroarcula pellucida]